MNYIDNNLRQVTQDKTIGIIIVKKDNKYIMEYCSDKRILSKEYKITTSILWLSSYSFIAFLTIIFNPIIINIINNKRQIYG